MNLPGTVVSAPTLTEKDREDLRFGVAQGVDYIALSFVRGAQDIMAAKELIAECGGDVPVIAKIERQEAVTDLEAILVHADGVDGCVAHRASDRALARRGAADRKRAVGSAAGAENRR